MRGDYQRERTSALTWLISAIVAGFVVQLLLTAPWLHEEPQLIRSLGLSVPGMRLGYVWTLLTHGFLHHPRFLPHILFTVLALYFLGRELLPMLGRWRFLGLFTTSIMVGGLAWLATHWHFGTGEMHVGAVAAVYAMFTVYACFFPHQELPFLLFFVVPVTLRPKYIAAALALVELVLLTFWEIPGVELPFGLSIASSAHLGGMLTGFIFYRFVYDSSWFNRDRGTPEIELPRWLKRQPQVTAQTVTVTSKAAAPDTEDLRVKVDRILDKINSQGFVALTPEEKRILDEARDQLSGR